MRPSEVGSRLGPSPVPRASVCHARWSLLPSARREDVSAVPSRGWLPEEIRRRSPSPRSSPLKTLPLTASRSLHFPPLGCGAVPAAAPPHLLLSQRSPVSSCGAFISCSPSAVPITSGAVQSVRGRPSHPRRAPRSAVTRWFPSAARPLAAL